ncbi:MAG: hypothetical protein LKE37_02425 [Atopobiaceae bacterium]|jgi:uncharacterized integral membrane protein|nr:hypothetical protein [Atopobiaceae bacterium]
MSQRSASNPRTQKALKGESSAGAAKRSVARAKPVREAAGTVRPVSAKSSKSGSRPSSSEGMSKEEKRAAKEVERQEEDQISSATDVVLKANEEYRKRRRLWWVLIAAGLVMTLISALMMYVFSSDTTIGTLGSQISIVTLVLAYVGIIGAFVWELVRVRPLRNEAEKQVRGLTARKRQKIIDEDFREKAAKKGK